MAGGGGLMVEGKTYTAYEGELGGTGLILVHIGNA